jgi:EpsI family protein
MLLVAYGGSQGGVIQVHRPEVCYPAGGYRLTRIEPHMTALAPSVDVPTRFIKAESDVRTEQIVYWTRLGSHFPRTWAEQRVAVLEENLVGNIPDGVLVRLSTLATGPVEGLLDGFARSLYRSVGPRMREVLVGER